MRPLKVTALVVGAVVLSALLWLAVVAVAAWFLVVGPAVPDCLGRSDRQLCIPSLGVLSAARISAVAVREAVRGLLIESTSAVLLMRIVEPRSQVGRWITPGGAVGPGETLTE